MPWGGVGVEGGGEGVGDGHTWKGKKGKGIYEPKAQTAGAYPGFISMKHLGVLLLPPGRDASPLHLERSAKIKLLCEIYI